MARRSPPCGLCGSADVVPIVYGLPGPALAEEAGRGDVELGGCIVFEGRPERLCRACGGTWSRGGGWAAKPRRGAGETPDDAD